VGTMSCGTPDGYHQHRKRGEQSCAECLEAHNARNRFNRALLRGGSGRALAECGTEAAYNRHIKQGGVACRSCKDANAIRSRQERGYKRTGPISAYKTRIVKVPVEIFAALWFTADAETLAELDAVIGRNKVDQWVQKAGF